AAGLEPDNQVPELKAPENFRLIGKEVPARAVTDVVSGQAGYGIDVRMPGMKHAVIARCPWFDGSLVGFDDSEARKVKGVLDVVAIPGPAAGAPATTLASGVAVVAESTWAAMKGRDALK